MSRNALWSTIAVGIVLLLVQLPVLSADAPVGKVLPRLGSSLLNGNALVLETTFFSGDNVTTKADSLALMQFGQGDQVYLGPATSVTMAAVENGLVVGLERGMALTRSGNGRQISVNALGLMIEPSGIASYDVAIVGNAVIVSPREGSVQVVGTNDSFLVPAGKTMQFEVAANPAPGPVGVGAHNISPGAAAGLGGGIGAAVGTILYLVERNDREDLEDDLKAAQSANQSARAALEAEIAALEAEIAKLEGELDQLCADVRTVSPSVVCP